MQHMVMSTNNAAGKTGGGPTASQKGMKNVNSSSSGLHNNTNTASGKNMRSMSLSKRLAMAAGSNNPRTAGNNTIDMGNLHNFQTVEVGGQPLDLNDTQMMQFNTIMAQNELLNQSSNGINGGK